jgi:error-prone DNA polymerase
VDVLPVDVNLSDARTTIEPTAARTTGRVDGPVPSYTLLQGSDLTASESRERPPGDGFVPRYNVLQGGSSPGSRPAVRIGLGYVASVGLDDAEALVAEREANGPFLGVADLARRAPLSRNGLEALVKGGACDGFGRRRDLLWELGLALRPQSVPGTEGEAKQLPLALEPTVETPELRDLTRWERMLADYRHTGLSVSSHPLALLRPHLPTGTLSSAELQEERHGRRVAVAGMTVARQRPSTAKGIVFMLLEDEHGQVNLIVPSHVYDRHRAVVRGEPLVLALGRYERVGENRNVVVSELESLGPLAREVTKDDTVWASLPRPHSFGRR